MKRSGEQSRGFIAVTLAVGAVAATSLPALAAPITWDGDTSSDWTNGSNWVGGTPPANSTSTDSAIFGPTLTTFMPVLASDRSISSITFQRSSGGWQLTGAGRYIVGGSGINDSANTSGTTNITNLQYGAADTTITVGSGGALAIGTLRESGGNRSLTLTGGTVTVGNLDAENGTRSFTLSNATTSTIIIQNAATQNFSSGAGIGGGTVRLGSKSALGTGTITLNEGSIGAYNVDLTGANAIANTISYGGAGNGSTIAGNNSIEFAGAFNYTNNSNNRTLNNNLTSGKQLIISGTVNLTAGGTNARNQIFQGSGETLISGNITATGGTGSLTKSGSGILTLAGTNSYAGTTTVSNSGGTMVFRTKASKTSATATFGTSTIAGLGVGVAPTYYTSGDVDALFANTLTGFSLTASTGVAIDTTAGDFTYATSQSAARSLTKLGANKLVLTGANTYSGATNVRGGTLLVNGTNSGTGAVTAFSGATLGGTGSIAGAVNVNNGAFLSPGESIESFAVASADIDGTLVIEVEDADPLKVDLLNVSGVLDITNTTVDFNAVGSLGQQAYVFATYGSLTGTQFASIIDLPANYEVDYQYANLNQIALVVVPEPSIAGLLIGGLLFMRRRR